MNDDREEGRATSEPTVGVHVHFGMTGTVPLRLADLFFTTEHLLVAEYGTITPVVGLLTGAPGREAAGLARTYRDRGLEGVRESVDRTTVVPYEEIERIVCHDGRWVAREKVAVHVADGPPYGYRIHAPVDLEAFADGLASFPPTATLPVEVRSGVGFDPVESLRRFRRGR